MILRKLLGSKLFFNTINKQEMISAIHTKDFSICM